MTTPQRVRHLPVYRVGGFTWPTTVPHQDALGRRWLIRRGGDPSFMGPPPRRERREDLVEADGISLGIERLGAKTMTLTVRAWIPHHLRDQTLLELGALCADPTRLHELRRTTDTLDLVREVTLTSSPLQDLEWLDPTTRAEFTVGFLAPDPRAHAATWQSAVAPAGSQPGGLAYEPGGLAYEPGGLAYGEALPTELATRVTNAGNVTAFPLIALHGPHDAHAVVVHAETGHTARYASALDDGEVVTLNADRFARRGVMPESAHSSIRGDVTSLWVRTGDLGVAAGRTATFHLAQPAPGRAPLRIALRSSYL